MAGIGGGVGLAAFYRALSLGTMSVVSPVAACGAVVPFAIAIATGERPSASRSSARSRRSAARCSRRSTSGVPSRPIAHGRSTLAAVAAVALGLFVYFLGLGSREGDVLSTLVGARVGSLSFLVAACVVRRSSLRLPRASLAAVAAVGLADVSANALFAFASGHGLLSLVSVLGSLYPVVTVLLAHVLLGERLTRAQRAGVLVALAGSPRSRRLTQRCRLTRRTPRSSPVDGL